MDVLGVLVLLSALHYHGQNVAMKVLLRVPEPLARCTPSAVNPTLSNHEIYDVTSYGAKCDGSISLLRPRVAASDGLANRQDPLFNSLHGDPRFAALVAHAKEKKAGQVAQ